MTILLAGIASAFWFVQVVQGSYYRDLAENNRLRTREGNIDTRIQSTLSSVTRQVTEQRQQANDARQKAEQQHRDTGLARQRIGQPLAEQRAVGEAGQRIVMRQPRGVLLRAALFGQVMARATEPQEVAERIVQRPAADRPPARGCAGIVGKAQDMAHDTKEAIVSGAGSTLSAVKDPFAELAVVTVPAGSAGKITTQIARPDPLVAPFTKGQSVGALKVLLGEQAVAEVPLVALEGVEQAGILGRAWDAIRLWIK